MYIISKMNRIIEDIVKAFSKSALFEMALDRANFVKLTSNLAPQIVENWCMIHYCTLFDPNNLNKNHWKQELDAYCYRLYNTKTKNNKQRILEQVFIQDNELNNKDVVYKWMQRKFRIEQINDIDHQNQICEDFIKYIEHLIYLISCCDYQELYRYINEDI